MTVQKPNQLLCSAAETLRLAIPSWAFAQTQMRAGKLLQPAASVAADTPAPKWRGTRHDHFFRLNISGS